MTKLERTLKEVGDLYEMYRVIKRYRIKTVPEQPSSNQPESTSLREMPPPQPKFDTPPPAR